jgi:PHD-finger
MLYDTENYKPVYLVYVNAYIVSTRQEALVYMEQERQSILGKRKVITDDDYVEDYDNEDMDDGDVCKYCLIGLDVEGNRLFICDACNQCVHQLCETPSIHNEEIEIDPWMCRECTAAGRKPIMNTNVDKAQINHQVSDEPAPKRINLQ